MNEFQMFSLDQKKKDEVPADSASFRKWLVEVMGDKLKRREYEGIQTFALSENMIVTVNVGLVAEAFGEKSSEDEIIVQVEDGSDSYETTWKELGFALKKGIIDKIREQSILDSKTEE